jgi:hypothetical protein
MARARSGRVAPDRSTPVADIRVGDTIVYSKYGGQTITIGGEELVILNARDVVAVANLAGEPPANENEPPDPRRAAAINRLEHMLTAVAEIQADEAAANRPNLVRAMMIAEVDPIPAETVAQARRLARQREHLIATGAYTTEAMRELRGDEKASTTHTWLSRRRKANELFTVTHDNSTLVPAFQLDDEGVPRKAVADVLEALAPAHLGEWATWSWFTSASPWLGGGVPAEVLAADPARVAHAASRFASNAA